MKALISTSSELYAKRLVRELNHHGAGVYVDGQIVGCHLNPRQTDRASFSGGVIKFPTRGQVYEVPLDKIENAFISGADGSVICASRT